MSSLRQYGQLVSVGLRQNRDEVAFIAVIQVAMTLGFVVGFGYFIHNVSERQALFLTTGTATNTLVTVALVGLPQILSQSKAQGRLDYFLALPISRELYLAAQVTYVVITALPGILFALVFGAWHYDLSLSIDPLVLAVVPLSMFSLAGVGVAIGVLSPHPNITNAFSNFAIFYVLLFAPILIPKEQLPALLQNVSTVLPTTYAADAMRGALTDLPGTHLVRSMTIMAGFTVVSLAASAVSVRRRG
jgi:ABC-2 type transport system permease protein